MEHNILLLMTALVPTTGHRDLMAFAAAIPESRVWVLINGLTSEPVALPLRVAALQEETAKLGTDNVVVRGSLRDDAPQNPEDHPHFWEWWSQEVNDNFPEVEGRWDFVVASEAYGNRMATALGAEFLPHDIGRELNPARGVDVRSNVVGSWDLILPALRRELQLRVTLFGQESVGKTTLSKLVAKELGADWLFEYARPYLEAVGTEVRDSTMDNIFLGESASQQAAFRNAKTPMLVLDTDLYTTLGYYYLWGIPMRNNIVSTAYRLRSDLYFLLPDDIPFEHDPLRYGGDKRESTTEFWRGLLMDNGVTPVELPRGLTLEEKSAFIVAKVREEFAEKVRALSDFVRA